MCRYREYICSCGHTDTESPPYLPCCDDYCDPEDADPPIKLKKNTVCTKCSGGDITPQGGPSDGGTSWTRTNSMNRGSGLGEEGDPGARLRHTVSTKMKVSGIAKLARSMTKKNKEKEPKKTNGVDGFLPDQQQRYEEINEMDEFKK